MFRIDVAHRFFSGEDLLSQKGFLLPSDSGSTTEVFSWPEIMQSRIVLAAFLAAIVGTSRVESLVGPSTRQLGNLARARRSFKAQTFRRSSTGSTKMAAGPSGFFEDFLALPSDKVRAGALTSIPKIQTLPVVAEPVSLY